ncbi:unnamed protein product [Malus baccata var. baccata]
MKNLRLSVFRHGFNSSECRKTAENALSRIRMLKQEKALKAETSTDIARDWDELLIRVKTTEHLLDLYVLFESFCKSVLDNLSIMEEQKKFPAEVKEAITSLIFAAPTCTKDVPELMTLRKIFEKKYGENFVSEETNLQSPDCAVNLAMVMKLRYYYEEAAKIENRKLKANV